MEIPASNKHLAILLFGLFFFSIFFFSVSLLSKWLLETQSHIFRVDLYSCMCRMITYLPLYACG